MKKILDDFKFNDDSGIVDIITKEDSNGGCKFEKLCLYAGFKKEEDVCYLESCIQKIRNENHLKDHLSSTKIGINNFLLYQTQEKLSI
jgi:hypothetical protein